MLVPAAVVVGSTVNPRWVAAEAVMLNALLVRDQLPAVASNRYPVPVLSMFRSENVAMPPTAARVVVPPSVPFPGFAEMVRVTSSVKVGTVLPSESCAATWTGGVSVTPAPVVAGCVVKTSCVTAAGALSKLVLVVPVRLLARADSVYPVPLRLTISAENVETPLTAATVRVPRRFAPGVPVPAVSSTVMLPLYPVAVFPCASWAITTTGGSIGSPAMTLEGCARNMSCVAEPPTMSNGALIASASPAAVARSIYPDPTVSTLTVENVATPALAVTVVVPSKVAPELPVPGLIATVTAPAQASATLPSASRAETTMVSGVPAGVVDGCVENVRWVAAPPTMSNRELVTGGRFTALAVRR